jgi:hypothetical protein
MDPISVFFGCFALLLLTLKLCSWLPNVLHARRYPKRRELLEAIWLQYALLAQTTPQCTQDLSFYPANALRVQAFIAEAAAQATPLYSDEVIGTLIGGLGRPELIPGAELERAYRRLQGAYAILAASEAVKASSISSPATA